jgi:hypothetical protein
MTTMVQRWLQKQTRLEAGNVAVLCAALLATELLTRAYVPALGARVSISPLDHAAKRAAANSTRDGQPALCRGEKPTNPLVAQVVLLNQQAYPLPLNSITAKRRVLAFLSVRMEERSLVDLLQVLGRMQRTGVSSGTAVIPVFPDDEKAALRDVLNRHQLSPEVFFTLGGAGHRPLGIKDAPTVLVFDQQWNIILDGRTAPGGLPAARLRGTVRALAAVSRSAKGGHIPTRGHRKGVRTMNDD